MKRLRPYFAAVFGLILLFSIAMPRSSAAQDDDRKDMEVRVVDRNGDVRIIVNGEEIDPDNLDALPEDVRARLRIVTGEDGKVMVYLNDGGEDGVFMRRRGPGSDRFFGEAPGARVWVGGHDDEDRWHTDGFALADRLEGLIPPFELDVARIGDSGFRFRYNMDREVMELESKSRELARRIRRAEGDERTSLETELDGLLQQIFDRKQALRAESVEEMEESIRAQREALDSRAKNRAEIIERRKAELVGKRHELDW